MYSDLSDSNIEFSASSVNPSHDEGFAVDFPNGMREFGFVYFDSPVVLDDRDGRHIRPPGTGIFFQPEEPRFYHAAKGRLRHTWFLAMGPGIDLCLSKYKIPTYTALDLHEIPFLETFIQDVRQEGFHLRDFHEDAVTDLCRDFFRRIGSMLATLDEKQTDRQFKRVKLLNEIRLCVQSDLARRWTVQEMADLCGLNPTRFAMEFKNEFGTSPIDDLIDARLKRSEYMLLHLSHTVKHIANECGFNSTEHFTRLFHSRRGCSPGQFRKA